MDIGKGGAASPSHCTQDRADTSSCPSEEADDAQSIGDAIYEAVFQEVSLRRGLEGVQCDPGSRAPTAVPDKDFSHPCGAQGISQRSTATCDDPATLLYHSGATIKADGWGNYAVTWCVGGDVHTVTVTDEEVQDALDREASFEAGFSIAVLEAAAQKEEREAGARQGNSSQDRRRALSKLSRKKHCSGGKPARQREDYPDGAGQRRGLRRGLKASKAPLQEAGKALRRQETSALAAARCFSAACW